MVRTVAERMDVIPVLADVFRQHGYEGASLSLITQATGLGKGSLYHFFPRGKEEMAEAVLAHIDAWFHAHVFTPLSETTASGAAAGIRRMLTSVDAYFLSGGKVCVVGVFALGDVRDRFAASVHDYFEAWIAALAVALRRLGHGKLQARALAEDVVGAIQGGLVLARALDDAKTFKRCLRRCEERMLAVA